MPLLDDLRDRMETLRATLGPLQVTYAALHGGRFFQGLPTHSAIPEDGQEVLPDRLNTRPRYQAETWNDFLGEIVLSTLPILLECHQYVNHAGQRGYFVVAKARVQGEVWRRSRGVGAEAAQFTTEWERIG